MIAMSFLSHPTFVINILGVGFMSIIVGIIFKINASL